MALGINCTNLAVRTDFDTYARKLVKTTHGDLDLLSQCKVEVCGALWGQGNSDISGIGVSDIRLHDHDAADRPL